MDIRISQYREMILPYTFDGVNVTIEAEATVRIVAPLNSEGWWGITWTRPNSTEEAGDTAVSEKAITEIFNKSCFQVEIPVKSKK